MEKLECTHLVLYTRDLEASHRFYAEVLGCEIRMFEPGRILSVGLGTFFINFYPSDVVRAGSVINHIGLEVPTRAMLHAWFKHLRERDVQLRLSGAQTHSKEWLALTTSEQLEANQAMGPYRFYFSDPDGYTLELHTWDGVDE